MANSKAYLGNINIGNAKLGTSDVKLYLGDMLVYPFGPKVFITYDVATYNGTLQTAQNIVVTDESGNTLVENVDYVVTENNGGTNAGTYNLIITLMGQYQGTARTNFVINKVTPTVTAPTAKVLTYNTQAQELVNAGSTDYGTLKYSLDEINYSTSIPSATTAGAYIVYYKVEGDSNINDVAASTISCSIAKANSSLSFAVTDLTVGIGETNSNVVTVNAGDGVVTYVSSDPSIVTVNNRGNISGISSGDTTVSANISSTSNYNSATTSYNVTCRIIVTTKFNVTSTSSPTKIADSISNFSKIEIDDVVLPSVSTGYTFSTTGEHTVKYYLNSTNIGNSAFYSATSLTSIDIPDIITAIGDNAFMNCSGLTSCTIGSGVTSIGDNAFSICSGLTSITVNATAPTTLGTSAFDNTNNCPIYVPCSSVDTYKETSGWSTYASRIEAISRTCPPTVIAKFNVTDTSNPTRIASAASAATSFAKIEIDGVEVSRRSGYTFSTTGEHTVKYYLNNNLIYQYAFSTCSAITSVEISDSVTGVSHHAFMDCFNMTSCTIGNSVTNIGIYAFYNCSNLTNIVIPDSVTSIGGYAFGSCRNLTSIDIPSGITMINYGLFENCGKLKRVNSDTDGVLNIPDTITNIYGYAFNGCSSLTSATIGSGVTSIGNNAFSYCSGFTSIGVIGSGVSFEIPSSVTSIGSQAFYRCDSLTSVTIPDSVTSIGDNVFWQCFNLTDAVIGSGVTSINATFKECRSLSSCTIGSSVTSIGNNTFGGCSGLTSIVIPNSVTTIGQSAFANCTGLTSIVIPDSVTTIGNDVFYYCYDLTSVTIGSGVTSIGDNAFRACSGLTSITVNAIVAPTIQSNTFQSVKTRGTLYVPQGSSGYDVWMGTGDYYLGKYNWTKVEQ